jgi:hypothetical protein
MDTPLRKAMRDAGMKESDFRWRELIMDTFHHLNQYRSYISPFFYLFFIPLRV